APVRAKRLLQAVDFVAPLPQAAVYVGLVDRARRRLLDGAVDDARRRTGRGPDRRPGSGTAAADRATDGADRRARRSADGRTLGDVLAGGALHVGVRKLAAFRDLAVGLLPAGLLQLLVGVEHWRLARGAPAKRQQTGENERQGPSGSHFSSLQAGASLRLGRTALTDLRVVRERLAGLEAQRFTATPADLYYHCFGCGPGHPVGTSRPVLQGRRRRLAQHRQPPVREPAGHGPWRDRRDVGRARLVADHGRYAGGAGRIEDFS